MFPRSHSHAACANPWFNIMNNGLLTNRSRIQSICYFVGSILTVGALAFATASASASVTIYLSEENGDINIYSPGGTLDLTSGFEYYESHTDSQFFAGYILGAFYGTDSGYSTSSESGITFTHSSGWTSETSANGFAISDANPTHWAVGINTLAKGGEIVLSREYDDTALTSVTTISAFSGTISSETLSGMGLTAGEWYEASWTNSSSDTDFVMIVTSAVPEPATCALFASVGALCLATILRRKNRK
jgi:hypothetical protein